MSGFNAGTLKYFKNLGVDYLWYTGIPRHATGKPFVKGDPGSPYAVSDWYDVNGYLADDPAKAVEEFENLVTRTHSAGLKVCIDYIPNHVACDYKGSLPLHEWCDYDWTDTLKVNWDDPRAIGDMTGILRFWAGKGVDAFRCDMVELVDAEALGAVIHAIKAEFPGILFIAEVYGRENYRRYIDVAGFDLLYDKSGVYDILRYVCTGSGSAAALTGNWQFLGGMQPNMINFLENHDERRIASPEFFGSAERAFAAMAYAALFNDASLLLYFGQEVGESAPEGAEGRTSIFNWCKPEGICALSEFAGKGKALDSGRAEILKVYKDILRYAKTPLFAEGKVWDLGYCQDDWRFNRDDIAAFIRYDGRSAALVVCNFREYTLRTPVRIPEEMNGITHCAEWNVEVEPNGFSVYFFE